MRILSRRANATVHWNRPDQRVHIKLGDTTLTLSKGEALYLADRLVDATEHLEGDDQ